MTDLRCHLHDIPIHNATICPRCLTEVENDLGDIPALIDELNLTLSRQDRIDRPVGKLEVDPDGDLPLTVKIQALAFNVNASAVTDELHATLVGWVRDIHGEDAELAGPVHPSCGDPSCDRIRRRAWPANTTVALARWLLCRLEQVRQHPAGDDLRDEIGYAVNQARRAVDRPAERIFAGPCLATAPDSIAKCPEDLYAIPGRETVKCRKCGTVHDVAERRAWLLAEAEDRLETAIHISQALSGLGMTVKYDRIRQWKTRGRLTPHGVDLEGRDLYRIGDVIELLAVDQDKEARRAG